VLAVAAVPALAQKYDVGPDTQLRIIEFEFDGSKTLSEEDLRKQIASPMLGKHTTLRRWFGFLPSVDPVEPAPFEPLEFQHDVARLREFYRRAGFPDAMLDYTAQKDVEKEHARYPAADPRGPPLRSSRSRRRRPTAPL
jgi:outer membrane protein assembly factor BamA